MEERRQLTRWRWWRQIAAEGQQHGGGGNRQRQKQPTRSQMDHRTPAYPRPNRRPHSRHSETRQF